MITTNTDKKALVEKLIQDKVITLDQGMLLLETEKEYISTPAYPYNQWPQYGYWRWNGFQMEWITYPQYPGFTVSGDGTLSGSLSTGNGALTVLSIGSCTTTVNQALSFPGSSVSYTAN